MFTPWSHHKLSDRMGLPPLPGEVSKLLIATVIVLSVVLSSTLYGSVGGAPGSARISAVDVFSKEGSLYPITLKDSTVALSISPVSKR